MSQVHINADPGTGTQYHVIACENPMDHPRLKKEAERLVEEENWFREEAELSMTQYSALGRCWQCEGDYWDRQLQDVVTLEAVVRKSSWCHAGEPEDGALKFQFVPEHRQANGHGYEFDPNVALQDEDRLDPTERFLPRHNVPFRIK